MAHFHARDETRGIRPDQIAVVGDRLLTDMCLANQMGAWGVWVRDGVVPRREKSLVRPSLPPSAPLLRLRRKVRR